jgi:hypothetical protein
MPAMSRKTTETTAGVSERYAEDRRGKMTPPALVRTAPKGKVKEDTRYRPGWNPAATGLVNDPG